MQIEISTSLVALAVTVGGVVVSAAVAMMLAAREARDAAAEVDRHAATLLAVQVTQARHEERLSTHAEEIASMRERTHGHANSLAALAARCHVEHGAE